MPEDGTKTSGSAADFRVRWEQRLTAPMVILSLIFLLLVGGVIHLYLMLVDSLIHQTEEFLPFERYELWLLVVGLLLIWPLFLLEFMFHVVTRDRRRSWWRTHAAGVLACFVPPLRMAARSHLLDKRIWIPFLGWQNVDRHLRKRLEKIFSIPMILIAFMILPLLALEFGEWQWAQNLREHPWVKPSLYLGNSIIWFAFALEFITMISVAERKWQYCFQHWLDLAIILLPLIGFLRGLRMLRLSQVLRMEQLSRMSRLYRLRGLSMRAWRAMLLLELIQRLTGQSHEKRLKRLQDILNVKEEEVTDIKKEIDDLKTKIAAKQAEKQATPPAVPEIAKEQTPSAS